MDIPSANGYLAVEQDNKIYWETSGDPTGIPVLFMHGGPGAGLSSGYKKHFDPSKHYIISFDQRGCGRSLPWASDDLDKLMYNNTHTLVEDIEQLRCFLKVKSMMIVGISFGTFLAIAYAQKFPTHVDSMVLGAITTLEISDISWITEGLEKVFPLEWKRFSKAIQRNKNISLVEDYYNSITNSSLSIRNHTAKAWCDWEDAHVSIVPDSKPYLSLQSQSFQLNFSTLVIHYWKHHGFFEHNQFIESIKSISHIPAVLIHGRMDISAPLSSVYKVHHMWDNSNLIIINDEGHGGPQIVAKLNEAIQSFSI